METDFDRGYRIGYRVARTFRIDDRRASWQQGFVAGAVVAAIVSVVASFVIPVLPL